MDCNNEFCTWCAFGQCCHESEEGHKSAVPNTLDCPSSLRSDFQEGLIILADECKKLIDQRNLKELLQLRKFIQNQRNNENEAWHLFADQQLKDQKECGNEVLCIHCEEFSKCNQDAFQKYKEGEIK